MIDEAGQLLVVHRRADPGRGLWALPGGRCENTETPYQTCVRETLTESGIRVRADRFAGRVVRHGPTDFSRYVIDDYHCVPVGGVLNAADDAMAAMWATSSVLCGLPLMAGLLDTLTEWGVLRAMDTRGPRPGGTTPRPTADSKRRINAYEVIKP